MHKEEGGDPTTDSYVWRRVRLTEETGAGRNVKLEVWDGGGFKLVADRVFFDVHEHFDPDFLWYSDYVPPGQSSPGIVERPTNVANDMREGWLLVAQVKLARGFGVTVFLVENEPFDGRRARNHGSISSA